MRKSSTKWSCLHPYIKTVTILKPFKITLSPTSLLPSTRKWRNAVFQIILYFLKYMYWQYSIANDEKIWILWWKIINDVTSVFEIAMKIFSGLELHIENLLINYQIIEIIIIGRMSNRWFSEKFESHGITAFAATLPNAAYHRYVYCSALSNLSKHTCMICCINEFNPPMLMLNCVWCLGTYLLMYLTRL